MQLLNKYFCGAAALFTLGATAASATTYSGNGNYGFSGTAGTGPLGSGMLTVTDNATAGTVTFSLVTGNGGGFNDIGFFFATGQANGVNSTANLIGSTTDGGVRVVTGDNTIAADKATIGFVTGFNANFGLDLNGGNSPFANLYSISSVTNTVAYVTTPTVTNSISGTYNFTLSESALGITAGQSISFVAYLLNPNSTDSNGNAADYLSNEALGASNAPAGATNIGLGGTLTFSSADTYTTGVPEPSTWAVMCAGGGMLGLALRRRFLRD